MGVILPSKAHVGLIDRDNPMIGYGNAMSIASEILQHVFSAAEGVALADVVRAIRTMDQQFMNNVAAKNAGLAQMVVEKKFRADLYYRLNIFPIEVPILRDRRDLPLLVLHFVD